MRPKLVDTSLDHITNLLKTLITFSQNYALIVYDKRFKAIKHGFSLYFKGNNYDEKLYFRNISLNHYKGLSLQHIYAQSIYIYLRRQKCIFFVNNRYFSKITQVV